MTAYIICGCCRLLPSFVCTTNSARLHNQWQTIRGAIMLPSAMTLRNLGCPLTRDSPHIYLNHICHLLLACRLSAAAGESVINLPAAALPARPFMAAASLHFVVCYCSTCELNSPLPRGSLHIYLLDSRLVLAATRRLCKHPALAATVARY